MQVQGLSALQNPEIQKTLKITAEQKEKFTEIRKSSQQKLTKIRQDLRANGGRIDFKKFREKIQEFAKDQEKKILEVLTKEQSEQFAKMKGKKIDLGCSICRKAAWTTATASMKKVNGISHAPSAISRSAP